MFIVSSVMRKNIKSPLTLLIMKFTKNSLSPLYMPNVKITSEGFYVISYFNKKEVIKPMLHFWRVLIS